MTDFHNFTFPVVDTRGPELHQGVYRQQSLGVPTGTGTTFLVLLGYLVQIWAKLMHQAQPRQVFPRFNVVGEGFLDTFTDKRFDNWQVSHVLFDIIQMPAGADMVFGEKPLIYVGRCAFFQSALNQNSLDWSVDPGLPPLGLGFTVGAYFQQPARSVPQTFREYTVATGIGNEFSYRLPNQFQEAQQSFVGGSVSFNFSPGTPRRMRLSGGVSGGTKYYYPVQWINHFGSVFCPPNPNASGIWWQLKPGVVAKVTVYGVQKDPEVAYASGEGGSARFNPMNGGQQ